ncbi:hypothetical protein BJ165DRAFT_249728 [Panaeolus papilionaceus]|nr:hypothetical protein BJ165DRAFT_249728 [Panaeolus papilionaceus]
MNYLACPYPSNTVTVCSVTGVGSEALDWKYQFTSTCISTVLEHLQSLPQPPPYSATIDADRIIRSFPLPSCTSDAVGVASLEEETHVYNWSAVLEVALQEYVPFAVVEMSRPPSPFEVNLMGYFLNNRLLPGPRFPAPGLHKICNA